MSTNDQNSIHNEPYPVHGDVQLQCPGAYASKRRRDDPAGSIGLTLCNLHTRDCPAEGLVRRLRRFEYRRFHSSPLGPSVGVLSHSQEYVHPKQGKKVSFESTLGGRKQSTYLALPSCMVQVSQGMLLHAYTHLPAYHGISAQCIR